MKLNQKVLPYLIVSPYFLHLLVFVLFPVLFSFFLTFNKWNIISPMEYAGLDNYRRMFSDLLFWRSLLNTFIFLIIHIPLQVVIALGLAEFLKSKNTFQWVFQSCFLSSSHCFRRSGDYYVATALWL